MSSIPPLSEGCLNDMLVNSQAERPVLQLLAFKPLHEQQTEPHELSLLTPGSQINRKLGVADSSVADMMGRADSEAKVNRNGAAVDSPMDTNAYYDHNYRHSFEIMDETLEYSRDSFSRFGDDLSEEMLRYVSLSDCFAFECVSKYFKRSVFGAQKKLDTKVLFDKLQDKSRIKLNAFNIESVLKKCLFINEINISQYYKNSDQIIDIIRDNCSQLTSISLTNNCINISSKALQLFGEKFGHSLRCISFESRHQNKESLQTLLRLTTNLIECEIYDLNYLIFKTEEREHVLPKLKKITANIDDESDFSSFADNYSDRVETIILRGFTEMSYWSNRRLRVMFRQLSRFQSLEVLSIEMFTFNLEYNPDIETAFDLITKNCRKLRELTLSTDTAIFARISHRFASLRRLSLISLDEDYDSIFSIIDLRFCPNLIELRIYFCLVNIYKTDFADIHIHLPKLQFFELDCNDGIADQSLVSLALLKELYYLKIYCNKTSVTDLGLRNFVYICQSIRKIDINCVKSISRQTVEAFVSHAKSASKCYNYSLRVEVLNGDESVGDNDMKDINSGLPKNINIDITVSDDRESDEESDD